MAVEVGVDDLLRSIRLCTICADHLAAGPRPIVQFSSTSRLVIVGQAPGARVHASGIPWDDASGDRMREWTGLSKPEFYDPAKVALVPMGFCFPGSRAGGDLPPRPECAAEWRLRILKLLPAIELTLVIGRYALDWHLKTTQKASLTQTVQNWKQYWPAQLPLPHPSPRNNIWLKKNAWFEAEIVPELQRKIACLLNG